MRKKSKRGRRMESRWSIEMRLEYTKNGAKDWSEWACHIGNRNTRCLF